MTGYSTNLFDVLGALEAHQFGMAAIKSRKLFEVTIDTFLVSQGKVSPDAGTIGAKIGESRFELLTRFYGKASPIYQQAIELDKENPMSPADVEEYASKCKAFVESVLGLSRLELYNIITYEAWIRHYRCFHDISNLLKFLGIRTFMSVGYGSRDGFLRRCCPNRWKMKS